MLVDTSLVEEFSFSSIVLVGTDRSVVVVDKVVVFLVECVKILVGFKAVNIEVFVTTNELDLPEVPGKTVVVVAGFVLLVFVLIEV